MLESELLTIEDIVEKDLQDLLDIHNDPSTLINKRVSVAYDLDQQKVWFKTISENKKQKRYKLVSKINNLILGILRIDKIDHENKNCEIGVDVARGQRNKGYASEAYRIILDHLFNELNMHMVYLSYVQYNRVAGSLYKKMGFRKTGFLREFIYRNGKYHDYVIMCLTKDEYLNNAKF